MCVYESACVCVCCCIDDFIYQLDLVLKKCFYPKSLFSHLMFFLHTQRLHSRKTWERERVSEKSKKVNQLTFDWKVLLRIEYICISLPSPVPQNRCSILKAKKVNIRTHERKWCVSKSDMMKWQPRQHRFDIYYMHAYAFAIRLYAGPNWISSVWQQRKWQRHISNWLFAKYFMCVSFFLRIFNSISVGVHSTHENSFWKSGI